LEEKKLEIDISKLVCSSLKAEPVCMFKYEIAQKQFYFIRDDRRLIWNLGVSYIIYDVITKFMFFLLHLVLFRSPYNLTSMMDNNEWIIIIIIVILHHTKIISSI